MPTAGASIAWLRSPMVHCASMWSLSSVPVPPIEGQREACSALLERLGKVFTEGRCRALVLHGPPGAGQRALGRWAVDVARAAGGDGLIAVHAPLPRPGDGVAGALIERVGLGELSDPRPLSQLLADALPAHGFGDDDDGWALGALAWPAPGSLEIRASERDTLLQRLLEGRAAQRPMVLFLDDAEWAAESVGLAQRLLLAQSERPVPLLILLGLRTELEASDPLSSPLGLADMRARLRSGGGAWEIALDAPAEPEAAQRVLDRVAQLPGPWRRAAHRLALLGGRSAGGEWRACTPDFDAEAAEAGLVALEEAGVAARWRGGWAFTQRAQLALYPAVEEASEHHAVIAGALERRYGRELAAERLVTHLLAAGDVETAQACIYAAAAMRRRSGQYELTERLLDRHDALSVSRGLPPEHAVRVRADLARATLYRVRGRLDDAMRLAERAVAATGRERESAGHLAESLRVLGLITTETDELDRAEALLARARVLFEELGDDEGLSMVYRDLSIVADRRGQQGDAERYTRASLEVAERRGDEAGITSGLVRLGLALRQQGRLDDALEVYSRAELRARQLRYRHALGSSLRGRAAVLRAMGRLDESVTVLREARDVMRSVGNQLGVAHCLNGLAEAARKRGDLLSAERDYRRALALFERHGSGQAVLPRLNLGLVLLGRGLTRQAREQLDAARAHLEAAGRHGWLGAVLVTLLPCLVADREWALWESHYHRALTLLADTRLIDADIAWAAELSGEWSEVGAKNAQDLSRAARSFELALRQWQDLKDDDGVERVTARLVELAREGSPIPLGPFDLERCEGAGGTGEVWVGRHRVQGVPVAVKVLTSAVAREPDVIEAFRGEVRAVAGLDHPNVIIVLDHGGVSQAAHLMSEGRLVAESPYLAMELCDAGTLSALCGQVPWSECKRVLLCLLDALAHSHSRGVVHRDLKPGNVLLEGDASDNPIVKLSDFGIAHALGGGPARRLIVGTPEYMAPEQFRGDWRTYGPWTDLYALGCVAVALVQGAPPFQASSPAAFAQAHWLQEPPPLQPCIPVPPGLEAWVRRLLAKSPRARYRRASDAAWGLLQLGPPDVAGFVHPGAAAAAPGAVHTFVFDDLALSADGLVPAEPTVAPFEVPFEVPVERAVEPVEVVLPPAPVNWRPLVPPPPPLALRGAGLALYGLRPIPVIGRQRERDLIWAALLAVVANEQPHSLLLSGAAGFGKSRLASWLGEQAHVMGLAELMHVEHRPDRGGGLVHALRARAHCQELEGAELAGRLETWMRGRGVADPGRWQALQVLFESAEAEPELTLAQADLLREELLACAEERALVIQLDAVHWGGRSLDILMPLLTAERAPVLVIMTARDDLLVERPVERAQIQRLRAERSFTEISVTPLPAEHRITLVKALLDLEDSLAQQVAARTGGNLRFAMELIRDWVDRDLLQVGEAGFHLRPGARTPLPSWLRKSWVKRVDRAVERLGPEARVALECLALAGAEQVRPKLWEEVCVSAGAAFTAELALALQAEALIVRQGTSWALVHAILRETLEHVAEEDGRAVGYRHSWAEILKRRGRGQDRARIGMLLMRAGEPEEAIEPVREAVEGHLAHGRPDEAVPLIEVWEEALRALGVGEDDPRWGEVWLARARMSWEQGFYRETERHAQGLLDASRRHGWDHLVALALRLSARGLEASGEHDEAWSRLVDAREIHRSRAESDGVAECMADLGQLARFMGRFEEGIEYFAEALEEFDSRDDAIGVGRSLAGMGAISLGRQDYELAEQYYQDGLRAYRRADHRTGEAEMWNGLGEVHRYRGRAEDAEREYRMAVEVFRSIGSTKALVPQLNLGLVLLQRGRFDEAEALFEQSRPLVERRGRHDVQQLLEGFQLAAADPRDRDWRERHDLVAAMLRDSRTAEPDMAWTLELAADRAARMMRTEQVRLLLTLALGQWERLEATDAMARVQAQLASLAPQA